MIDIDRPERAHSRLETKLANKDKVTGVRLPCVPEWRLAGTDHQGRTDRRRIHIDGWTAHIIEQANANALIRPLSD